MISRSHPLLAQLFGFTCSAGLNALIYHDDMVTISQIQKMHAQSILASRYVNLEMLCHFKAACIGRKPLETVLMTFQVQRGSDCPLENYVWILEMGLIRARKSGLTCYFILRLNCHHSNSWRMSCTPNCYVCSNFMSFMP
ncbi:hypothetical protein B0H14DRAFT_1369568 [Mycena olivaceomarginata]|nr:hypothetical protein B0H14DRAFT_1369568 [Mycena olivaceomarginata]